MTRSRYNNTHLPQLHILDFSICDIVETPPLRAFHLQRNFLHHVPPLVNLVSTRLPVCNIFSPTCCPWELTQPQFGSVEPSSVMLVPPLNLNLKGMSMTWQFGGKGRELTNILKPSTEK